MFIFVCVCALCAWKKLEFGSEEKVFVSLFHDEGKICVTYIAIVFRYTSPWTVRMRNKRAFAEWKMLLFLEPTLGVCSVNLELSRTQHTGRSYDCTWRTFGWTLCVEKEELFAQSAEQSYESVYWMNFSLRRRFANFRQLFLVPWVESLLMGNLKHWNSTPGQAFILCLQHSATADNKNYHIKYNFDK